MLRLFGDFPPVFLFGSKISAHSTKQAPPFLNLSVRTAQPCSSPPPRRASPHPLQNRVLRVQVLLPLPKKSGIAFAMPDFFVSEQKDLAAGCARRAHLRCVSWGPAALWAASRPDRAGRRDRVWPKCYSFFRRCSHPLPPVLTRSHPLQHPKRTRFRLFRLNLGAFSLFSPFWTCKIFKLVFVHPAA